MVTRGQESRSLLHLAWPPYFVIYTHCATAQCVPCPYTHTHTHTPPFFGLGSTVVTPTRPPTRPPTHPPAHPPTHQPHPPAPPPDAHPGRLQRDRRRLHHTRRQRLPPLLGSHHLHHPAIRHRGLLLPHPIPRTGGAGGLGAGQTGAGGREGGDRSFEWTWEKRQKQAWSAPSNPSRCTWCSGHAQSFLTGLHQLGLSSCNCRLCLCSASLAWFGWPLQPLQKEASKHKHRSLPPPRSPHFLSSSCM